MSAPGNAWRRIHGRVTKRPTNFSWVIDGKLAGSGIPTSREEFEWITAQGVSAVVTMTENALPQEWLRDAAADYLHVPTPDLTAPDMDEIDSAVEFIRDRISEKRPVMVHCAAGMGRAGTILACYHVKYMDCSGSEAVKRIREARPGSIQSDVQEIAISMYERHVRGGGGGGGNS